MRFILSGLLMLLTASAAADDTLVVTKAGYYLLRQDAAGVPTLTKIVNVVRLDMPPDNPPESPSLENHRVAIATATAAVTDPNKTNVKKALSELYRTVAGLPVTTRDQLTQATDTLFSALNLPLWVPWKTAVDRSLAGFVSLEDAKRAWLVVAEVVAQ